MGSELHKKCVWRQGSARICWGICSFSPPDPLAVIGRKGKETVGNTEVEEGECRKEWVRRNEKEGGERVGKV